MKLKSVWCPEQYSFWVPGLQSEQSTLFSTYFMCLIWYHHLFLFFSFSLICINAESISTSSARSYFKIWKYLCASLRYVNIALVFLRDVGATAAKISTFLAFSSLLADQKCASQRPPTEDQRPRNKLFLTHQHSHHIYNAWIRFWKWITKPGVSNAYLRKTLILNLQ